MAEQLEPLVEGLAALVATGQIAATVPQHRPVALLLLAAALQAA